MGLVYDQRAAVESIEDNIETAYLNQEAGTSTLIKAATSRVSIHCNSKHIIPSYMVNIDHLDF